MADDDIIYSLFIESCLEQLSGIESAVLDLERAAPGRLRPTLDAVFRAAHTIKGDAGALGAKSLVAVCHAIESVLTPLREAVRPPSGPLVGELLAAFDLLKSLVEDVRAAPDRDVAAAVARLEALVGEDPEPAGRPAEAEAGPAEPGDGIKNLTIPADALDVLVDRVGELGIAQSRLLGLARRRTDKELSGVAEEIERLAALLRDQVLSLRMLPLKIGFLKYRRLVRDACAALGKEAEFVMSGENTELDKAVIEQLNTPFIHLLRNAVDHGIEPPEVRAARGKPRRGRIELSARQEGNEVVIAVADDGAGIDGDALFRKAEAAGLVEPGRAYSPRERMELLFLPGLSTAEAVGPVSGRGVGMDAVRQELSALRGRIEVASTFGAGATFAVRLPVSLAIIDCLEVAAAGETYYFHLDYVEECLELPYPEDGLRGGRGTLDVRGAALPLLSLRVFFDLQSAASGPAHVVVVRDGGRRVGMVVDEVLGQKQAVLKHLGRALGKVEGVLGGTVTESGDMALVLDVPGLVKAALAEASHAWRRAEAMARQSEG